MARRQTVAEEHAFRAAGIATASHASHGRLRRLLTLSGAGWTIPWRQFPSWFQPEQPRILTAGEVASIYRALRKAREDSKDEPGAADFYYGEMEMRRKADTTSGPEWVMLSLYWLVSGYALRASRAFLSLAVVIIIGAFLLAAWSVDSEVHFAQGLLTSLQSAISPLHAPDELLNLPGEFVQVCLRVLGPALLGLAVLSLRGRVKR